MKPWEFHPILLHFPLAFLLGGVLLDLWAVRRPRESLTRTAAGLLVAGTAMAWLTVAAGILAFFTAPHPDEAHELMYWHGGFALAATLLFSGISRARWRGRALTARTSQALLSILAAALLVVAGFLGGHMVYRQGAGVSPEHAPAEEGHEHDRH